MGAAAAVAATCDDVAVVGDAEPAANAVVAAERAVVVAGGVPGLGPSSEEEPPVLDRQGLR